MTAVTQAGLRVTRRRSGPGAWEQGVCSLGWCAKMARTVGNGGRCRGAEAEAVLCRSL